MLSLHNTRFVVPASPSWGLKKAGDQAIASAGVFKCNVVEEIDDQFVLRDWQKLRAGRLTSNPPNALSDIANPSEFSSFAAALGGGGVGPDR